MSSYTLSHSSCRRKDNKKKELKDKQAQNDLIWLPDDVFWRGFYEDFSWMEKEDRDPLLAIKAEKRQFERLCDGVREGKTMIFHFIMPWCSLFRIFPPHIDSTLKNPPAYIYIYAELSLHSVVEFTSLSSSEPFSAPTSIPSLHGFLRLHLMAKRFTGLMLDTRGKKLLILPKSFSEKLTLQYVGLALVRPSIMMRSKEEFVVSNLFV